MLLSLWSSHISEWNPAMQMLAALCLLALAALLAGLVARWLVLRLARHLRESLRADWAAVFLHDSVLRRLARAVPSLMVQFGIPAVPALPPRWTTIIANAAICFTVYHLARALCDLLDAMNEAHDRADAR